MLKNFEQLYFLDPVYFQTKLIILTKMKWDEIMNKENFSNSRQKYSISVQLYLLKKHV